MATIEIGGKVYGNGESLNNGAKKMHEIMLQKGNNQPTLAQLAPLFARLSNWNKFKDSIGSMRPYATRTMVSIFRGISISDALDFCGRQYEGKTYLYYPQFISGERIVLIRPAPDFAALEASKVKLGQKNLMGVFDSFSAVDLGKGRIYVAPDNPQEEKFVPLVGMGTIESSAAPSLFGASASPFHVHISYDLSKFAFGAASVGYDFSGERNLVYLTTPLSQDLGVFELLPNAVPSQEGISLTLVREIDGERHFFIRSPNLPEGEKKVLRVNVTNQLNGKIDRFDIEFHPGQTMQQVLGKAANFGVGSSFGMGTEIPAGGAAFEFMVLDKKTGVLGMPQTMDSDGKNVPLSLSQLPASEDFELVLNPKPSV